MSMQTPTCPAGGEVLTLTSHGDLDLWVCPALHGAGVTLSETYGSLQDDEVHGLWRLARAAGPSAGARSCPMCERPMAAVDVPFDGDEADDAEPGDGAESGAVPLDVCVECQVIWFDAGEMERFPDDLDNVGPSEEELARLAEIRAAFGDSVAGALRERNTDLTDRAYAMIARHPRALHALDAVGQSVLPDFRP